MLNGHRRLVIDLELPETNKDYEEKGCYCFMGNAFKTADLPIRPEGRPSQTPYVRLFEEFPYLPRVIKDPRDGQLDDLDDIILWANSNGWSNKQIGDYLISQGVEVEYLNG